MRARWLKPEFFNDRKMAAIGLFPALLYQSLWCMADDGGVALAAPERIKGTMWMYWSAVGVPEITEALRVLSDTKRIRLYTIHDEQYAEILTWEDHQSIHKPSKFRYPRVAQQLIENSAAPVPEVSEHTPDTPIIPQNSPPPRLLDTKTPRLLDTHTPNAASNDAGVSKVDQEFGEVWASYPKRSGGNSRHDSLKAYRARRRSGVEHTTVLEGLKRYATYCEAKGWIGTDYVMQAQRFLGPSEQYTQSWELPKQTPTDRRLVPGERTKANIDAMLGRVSA